MRIDASLPSAESRRALGFLAAGALACAAIASAQVASSRIRHFSVPEYHDPPNETQLRSLLQGADAELQPGGLVSITDAQYRTFRENGRTEILVQAPNCLFDSVQRTAHSPGPLQVNAADDSFRLDGEGFMLQLTNFTLNISNRVHAVIQTGKTKTPEL